MSHAILEDVDLSALPVGTVLDVDTANSHYRIENRGEGEVLISGNPEVCPNPVRVDFHGSSVGKTRLKAGIIAREMNMEFLHPQRGIVRTSRVREIREQ
jgi:hypothetical protein